MLKLESRTVTCYVHTEGVNGKVGKNFTLVYTRKKKQKKKKKEETYLWVKKKNMFRPPRKTEFWKLETGNAAVTDDAEALQG